MTPPPGVQLEKKKAYEGHVCRWRHREGGSTVRVRLRQAAPVGDPNSSAVARSGEPMRIETHLNAGGAGNDDETDKVCHAPVT